MATDHPTDGDTGTPTVIEIPTNRVEGVITVDDIAGRLAARSGAAGADPAADLARRLAQELGGPPSE